jgi:poly(3-hydroxybutyrate) depolymerase
MRSPGVLKLPGANLWAEPASWLGALALAMALSGCRPLLIETPPVARESGRVVLLQDRFGPFYVYVPAGSSREPEILVLVHGTPAADETAEASAQRAIESWVDFADSQDAILIAPAFSQEDFSSRYGDRAQGGYRGLFGREIAADAWVLRLATAYQQAYGAAYQPFLLYGHSAGGQFVARFLVTHPDRVKRAVIASAATYPQPTVDVSWPFGMGELHTGIVWDDGSISRADILPDKKTWVAATQVPLTVIVGLNDTSELPPYPGQTGKNRFAIGRNWVRDMATFARANGRESRYQVEIVPGKGHSMAGLLPYAKQALQEP